MKKERRRKKYSQKIREIGYAENRNIKIIDRKFGKLSVPKKKSLKSRENVFFQR